MNHHAGEGDADDVVGGYADEELVQDAGEEEDDDLRKGRGAAAADERGVDVASHEICHGLVPRRPVGADGADVPPVAVKFAVAEAHDLC